MSDMKISGFDRAMWGVQRLFGVAFSTWAFYEAIDCDGLRRYCCILIAIVLLYVSNFFETFPIYAERVKEMKERQEQSFEEFLEELEGQRQLDDLERKKKDKIRKDLRKRGIVI